MRDNDDRTPAWRRYLRFWGSSPAEDVSEELAFHIDALTAEYVRAGMTPDDARRAALERFGNLDDVARTMRALTAQRETRMRRGEWLDDLGRDLHSAFRQLTKRRGFAVIALLTLALGIGANTAIFSAVNAVLLHPIPTADIDRVVVVHTNLPTLNLMEFKLGPGEALDIMKREDLFDASGGWVGGGMVLTDAGEPQRLTAARTIGRFYRPDESTLGQQQVAVLGHALWRQLGADRRIVGQRIQLNGQSFEVVGVAPAGFDYPGAADLYVPLPLDPQTASNRSTLVVTLVGRMRSGMSMEQFQAGIKSETERWHRDPRWHYADAHQFLSVVPLTTVLAGQLRPVLLVLLGAVAFVLLIACANIASLQLVHGAARQRELAVRAALGAGRARLVRQLLIENLVVSVCGGVLGVAVGYALLSAFKHAGASEMPALQSVHLDGAVLLFAAATTIAAGLLFGVAPAVRGGRVDLNHTLKETTRSGTSGRGKNRLLQFAVMAQVALTVVLLLGSGLMIRSLDGMLRQNPGFNAEHVLTMRASLSGQRYATGKALTAFYDQLLTRLSATPGIASASLVSDLPFSGASNSSLFRIIGRPEDPNGPAFHADMRIISDEYFRTMGVPLLRGRLFDSQDVKNAPTSVIVDAEFARVFFPNEDPIGKRIMQGPEGTIVGVVGSVSQSELGEPHKATVYHSNRQADWVSSFYVVVRSALPTATVASAVRNTVAALDPRVPVFDLRTLDDRIQTSLAPRRLARSVLTGLAVLSLLLSICGLYGVISYAVSQRAAEFGIRVALGAQAADVRTMVVRQGLALAGFGVAVGLIAATVATTALRALLFDVSPRDPITFVSVGFIVIAVSVGASYLPARRATKVSPLDALRS